MEKKRRREIGLVLVLLVVSGLSYFGIRQFQNSTTENAVAVIFVEDKEVGRYPLSKDIRVTVSGKDDGENVVEIKDCKVRVVKASCPDLICVHHQEISKNGETIVCLPNRVVVEVQSEEEAEVDGTTH